MGKQPQAKKEGLMRRPGTIPDNLIQQAPRILEPGFASTLSLLHPGLPTRGKVTPQVPVAIPGLPYHGDCALQTMSLNKPLPPLRASVAVVTVLRKVDNTRAGPPQPGVLAQTLL